MCCILEVKKIKIKTLADGPKQQRTLVALEEECGVFYLCIPLNLRFSQMKVMFF